MQWQETSLSTSHIFSSSNKSQGLLTLLEHSIKIFVTTTWLQARYSHQFVNFGIDEGLQRCHIFANTTFVSFVLWIILEAREYLSIYHFFVPSRYTMQLETCIFWSDIFSCTTHKTTSSCLATWKFWSIIFFPCEYDLSPTWKVPNSNAILTYFCFFFLFVLTITNMHVILQMCPKGGYCNNITITMMIFYSKRLDLFDVIGYS